MQSRREVQPAFSEPGGPGGRMGPLLAPHRYPHSVHPVHPVHSPPGVPSALIVPQRELTVYNQEGQREKAFLCPSVSTVRVFHPLSSKIENHDFT